MEEEPKEVQKECWGHLRAELEEPPAAQDEEDFG
jgi:hypothetical protein